MNKKRPTKSLIPAELKERKLKGLQTREGVALDPEGPVEDLALGEKVGTTERIVEMGVEIKAEEMVEGSGNVRKGDSILDGLGGNVGLAKHLFAG